MKTNSSVNIFLKKIHKTSQIRALESVLSEFEKLPYENITKRYKNSYSDNLIHTPDEVLSGFYKYGSGGTCFSITYALKTILDELKIQSYFVLADRDYGENTHCALVAQLDKEYICDPSYFIFKPIAVGNRKIFNDFNDIELQYPCSDKIEVFTNEQNRLKKRYTIKTAPVLESDFIDLWLESYKWQMMETPIVMKKIENKFFYLKPDFICIKTLKDTKARAINNAEFKQYLGFLGINMDSNLAKVS